jgi:signal transduction histidine kinase
MADQTARPNAEALYLLALRLGLILEPEEAVRSCLEGCATLVGAEAGMLLCADLPAAALGIPTPGPQAVQAMLAVPAVRAAGQMIGVSALPSGAVPLPGGALVAGSIPSQYGSPGVLLLGCAALPVREARLTLTAALALVSQTLDRSRHHRAPNLSAAAQEGTVSRLVHDIRSPLVATHASIEVVQRLLRGHAVPAPAFDALATGLRSVQAALELCNDMLELSRLHHSGAPALRQVALHRLLGDVVQMLRPLAEQRALRLDVCLDTEPLVVLGDERLLRRMLVNLVSNGLRFAPVGGAVLVAAMRGDDNAMVILRVSDDGPGISAEDYERIFLPFGQGSGESGRGVGLGLALCREVAQAHGGRIWVEERPGGGTIFSVALPERA